MYLLKTSRTKVSFLLVVLEHGLRSHGSYPSAIALFTILQKIPEEKSVFSVGVFNSIGSPPQLPLKRGAFRLNMMCKNIYIVNSVNI
ncbi:hypothetical protein BCV64_11105 [Cylindrospermopsis raciborskii MVCC14]|nr:hypothetical protein BCV64_11105 [Cylindrospermopsis raciborskii MVCC14]